MENKSSIIFKGADVIETAESAFRKFLKENSGNLFDEFLERKTEEDLRNLIEYNKRWGEYSTHLLHSGETFVAVDYDSIMGGCHYLVSPDIVKEYILYHPTQSGWYDDEDTESQHDKWREEGKLISFADDPEIIDDVIKEVNVGQFIMRDIETVGSLMDYLSRFDQSDSLSDIVHMDGIDINVEKKNGI